MRKFTLITILLLTCWLAVGIFSAKGGEYEETKVAEAEFEFSMYLSALCNKPVMPREVLFVGYGPEGDYAFYSPLDDACMYVGFQSQAWTMPAEYFTIK
jgi:hypothetical protein